MSKQISVKSVKANDALLKKMYDEANTYLETIGFTRTPLISITDLDNTFRGFLFTHGKEKILVEYKKDLFEEILKLVFQPLEIQFVYDILLMRFRQIAMDEQESVFIYND